MIFQLAVAFTILVFTAAAAAAAESALYSSNLNKQLSLFDDFKRVHGKSYASEEEEAGKFQMFVANLHLADARNEAEQLNGGTAVHGVNKFFDITPEEFTATYLRAMRPDSSTTEKKAAKTIQQLSAATPQALVDWTGIYTTAVKYQGGCGCCWAFATVQQIESDAIRTKNWSVNSPLSTAQVCECTYPNRDGCAGGWSDTAYDYVKSVGGIQHEVNRPFNSTYYSGSPVLACTAPSSSYLVTVSDYYYTPNDEPSIASYVQTTGPVQVFVSAKSWHTYVSGIMTICPNNSIDHGVQAVGVDTAAGYWKLRNSWGSSWGEAGHIRLAYNQDLCNIESYGATYTSVELTNAPTAGPTSMPSIAPSTMVPTAPGTLFCPSFSVANTSSATINYATCHINACPGDRVVMSTFSPGSCSGDIYLRLYDPSTGNQLAANDDFNSSQCSQITYAFTASCRAYTLREGCFQSKTCGGQVVYSGNTLLTLM